MSMHHPRLRRVAALFGVCLAALALAATTALAKAIDSVDDAYDFKSIRKVLIYDIDDPNKQVAGSEEPSLQNSYHLQAAKLLEVPSMTPGELRQELTKAGSKPDDPDAYDTELSKHVQLTVRAQFDKYETGEYIIPAHTEWRTVRERASYKDKDGKWREMWIDRSVPVFVPDQVDHYITVKVTFTGADAESGKVVFLREEQRQATGTTDRLSMFNRIVRSYFRDLKKKIK